MAQYAVLPSDDASPYDTTATTLESGPPLNEATKTTQVYVQLPSHVDSQSRQSGRQINIRCINRFVQWAWHCSSLSVHWPLDFSITSPRSTMDRQQKVRLVDTSADKTIMIEYLSHAFVGNIWHSI